MLFEDKFIWPTKPTYHIIGVSFISFGDRDTWFYTNNSADYWIFNDNVAKEEETVNKSVVVELALVSSNVGDFYETPLPESTYFQSLKILLILGYVWDHNTNIIQSNLRKSKNINHSGLWTIQGGGLAFWWLILY